MNSAPAPEPPLPLAPNQETLWEFLSFLSPGDPGASRFNIIEVMQLDGELDGDAVAAAVADVVARHDALRLVFVDTGLDPLLRIVPEFSPTLHRLDLDGLPYQQQLASVLELCDQERDRELDLHQGPLWRVHLVRLAPRRHLVVASFFHLVADGWSAQIFLRDLSHALHARNEGASGPPPLPAQYRDVIESRSALAAGAPARAEFWRRQLSPLPTEFPFPVARPDAPVDIAHERECEFAFAPATADGLAGLAQRGRTTPFHVLLAAYTALLAIRTGWERLVIGTTTLGRDLPGTMDLIGQFTNNIYVNLLVDPNQPVLELIETVHRAMTDTVGHVAPFQEIAAAVNPDFADQRPWPFLHLYHAWFQSMAPARSGFRLGDLSAEWVRQEPETSAHAAAATPARTSHLVEVTHPRDRVAMLRRGAPAVEVRDDRLGGTILYNPDFFQPELVSELARDYEAIVAAVVDNPWQTVTDLEQKFF